MGKTSLTWEEPNCALKGGVTRLGYSHEEGEGLEVASIGYEGGVCWGRHGLFRRVHP